MVEDYFAADPEFERMARRMADSMAVLKATTLKDEDALEERALGQLRARNMSLGAVFAGIFAILLLVATEGTRNTTLAASYPLIVVACVAIFALLAKHTRKTGL